MPGAKLTRRVVDALAPGDRTVIHYDADLAGFGLRITSAGGSAATLTPDEARRAARDLLASIRLGADPAASRKTSREMPTFGTFARRYLDGEAAAKLKLGTAANCRTYLLKHAAALATMKLDSGA